MSDPTPDDPIGLLLIFVVLSIFVLMGFGFLGYEPIYAASSVIDGWLGWVHE